MPGYLLLRLLPIVHVHALTLTLTLTLFTFTQYIMVVALLRAETTTSLLAALQAVKQRGDTMRELVKILEALPRGSQGAAALQNFLGKIVVMQAIDVRVLQATDAVALYVKEGETALRMDLKMFSDKKLIEIQDVLVKPRGL